MPRRPAKHAQSDLNRILKAAAKAGMSVEIRLDGTIIVSTFSGSIVANLEDRKTDLDEWLKKHHAHPA